MTTSEARYKETDSEENLGLISNNGTHDVHQKSRSWSKFILSFTTIGFGLLSLILAVKLYRISPELTFKDGYLTDWGPAKAAIEIQQVTYTSAFRYNETSQRYYREFDPNLPQYVGAPSPKIDDAWEELLKGQYVVLNETEAMNLDNPVPIEGMYLAEVEVMHSLHCLNAIRKEIDRDYYDKNDRHPLPKEIRQTHVEHCMEQLRQHIQCALDLTPVPLRPYGEKPDINLIGTPQVHTCRNWDQFRDWYHDYGTRHGNVNGSGT